MNINQLEQRVAALEEQVGDMAKKMGGTASPASPNAWIDEVHGTFEDDATYRKAMRLGRQWRKAQGVAASPRRARKAASR